MTYPSPQHADTPLYPGQTDPGATTQYVQAATEGVDKQVEVVDDNTIDFMGKRFRLAESIALMPLLKFAHSAKQGLNSDDMEGLSAMYLLIRSCLDQTKQQQIGPDGTPLTDEAGQPVWVGASAWELFEQHAIDTLADGEDLSEFIGRAISVVSARPRKRRGGSSPSSSPTSANSRGTSSSPATRPVPAGFEGMAEVSALGR